MKRDPLWSGPIVLMVLVWIFGVVVGLWAHEQVSGAELTLDAVEVVRE